jgi:HEAT repeat protein
MRAQVILLAVLLTAGCCAATDQPALLNARLETRSAVAGLEKALGAIERSQTGAAWVGYAVPVIPGEHDMCCLNSYGDYRHSPNCCGGCRLEGQNQRTFMGTTSECQRLEPSGEFFVFLRVEQGRVGKVRAFSANCELDAGGVTLYWLTDVRPAESVALLMSLAEENAGQAIATLAMHADPSATPALIQLARSGRNAGVRSDALFWLAQKAGDRVAGVITEAIERDPDTDVKKKAVFAVSQMPESEGVPVLIQVVKNNRNPAVRKEAMFWLGQSQDPRALDFIASILR